MRTAKAEYAVYKGDQLLCIGTAEQCAEDLGVRPDTIRFYTTPAYQERINKRRRSKNARTAIRVDDEGGE